MMIHIFAVKYSGNIFFFMDVPPSFFIAHIYLLFGIISGL